MCVNQKNKDGNDTRNDGRNSLLTEILSLEDLHLQISEIEKELAK